VICVCASVETVNYVPAIATDGNGRELSAEVQGIVISNGLLHQRILDAVNHARETTNKLVVS
jgi:hypothetical protein